MNSKEILDQVWNLVAQDRIEEAIEAIKDLLDGSDFLNELIVQSGRYSDLMKQIRMGLITQENADVSKNNIRLALIEMISAIEDGAKVNPAVAKEVERIANAEGISIINSKNIVTRNVNTNGGNFIVGDGNISISDVNSSMISIIKDKIMK